MRNKEKENARWTWIATAIGVALMIVFANAQSAHAQWSGSPNIYYNSGNVGIGTTSDNHNLHVAGSILFDSMTSDFMEMSSTNGPYVRFQKAGVVQGYFGFANPIGMTGSPGATAQGWFSNGNVFIEASGGTIRLTGNVGIGTSSPGSKLDVNGVIRNSAANGFSIGNDAGQNRILTSGNAFQFLTSSNAAAYGQVGGLAITSNYGNTAPSNGLYVEGNVGIGTGMTTPAVALDVHGDIQASGVIHAKYQDVAEWVPSSEQLAAGTVVVLDSTKSNQVTSSTVSYDTRVAGVVSEQPGIALGEKSDGKVLVATTGRVRVKVDATKNPIHIGDLLVTSNVPGMAMKSEPIMISGRQIHAPGTLIGKALEPLDRGTGTVLVLLSLQ